MSTSKEGNRRKFVVVHGDARQTIKLAKEEWFSCKQREEDTMVKHYGDALETFRKAEEVWSL